MNTLDRVTCEHAFRHLDDYLDHELTPQEMQEIKAHLEICTMCAKEFQFQAQVITELRERVQRLALSPTLHGKVTTALRKVQAEMQHQGKGIPTG